MHRRPLEEMPQDHRRFRGVFEGVTDEGQTFRLEVRDGRKRLNSNEMVRAHMQAMTRGRPLASLYKETVEIMLFVPDCYRTEIEILPSGMYGHGRYVDRTLRGLVATLLEQMRPRRSPPAP